MSKPITKVTLTRIIHKLSRSALYLEKNKAKNTILGLGFR